MTRTLVCGVVAACVAAGLGVSAQPQPPVFRGAGELVRVFATVIDHDGRLVTALTKADFEVRDDGKPQPILVFDNTPKPVRMIVMLDVSGSMEGNLPLLRAAADQLFARLGPNDVARVGTFGRDITISPSFTHDAVELRHALPTYIEPEAPTPLWRAADQALDALKSGEETRPVLLLLTDGKDSGPISFRAKNVSQAEIIDRARREDVMVYAIGMRSRMSRPPVQPGLGRGGLQAMLTADLPDPGLAVVAEQSGGGYAEIRFGQDLGAAFAQVADELHSQYLLGFEPPKRDGKIHSIDVRVVQKGMKPRARKNYVAPR